MEESDLLPDNTVMGWVGLKDNSSHYSSSAGLYDFFWLMGYDTRKKIIDGWKEALDDFLDPDWEPRTEDGTVYVTEGEEIIEHKIDAKIIPFPSKR